jgi:ribosome-associated protein
VGRHASSVVPYGQETTRHLANRALVSHTSEDLPNWAAAAQAAESKKAVDLRILDLREATSFTDYFVICTATNPRQGQAISDEIHKLLKQMGELPVSVEGFDSAEWILMDYGDFLVHIFSESARSYYDLERLWRHAKVVETLPHHA